LAPYYTIILSSTNTDETETGDNGIGVGIDLGTTYSAVAYLSPDTNLPTIIPVPENGRTMPSVVTFTRDHQKVLVGKQAIALEAEQGSYRNVKRILGRGSKAAQDSRDVVPFLITDAGSSSSSSSSSSSAAAAATSGTSPKKKKGKQKYKNNKDTLEKQIKDAEINPAMLYNIQGNSESENAVGIPPVEVSARILQKLIQTAEEHTGQKVTRAVIGVPAYFHDAQRDATIKAANLAGLDKVKLLREPEAAALAYGVGKQELTRAAKNFSNKSPVKDDDDDDDDELVLVFDLGGGTYDVSMLLVGGGLTEIITTSGDSQLGGSDFDAKVAQHLRKVLAGHGLYFSKRKAINSQGNDDDTCSASDALLRSAEMARIYLSNNKRVKMALPLDEDSWSHMPHASDMILPVDYELDNGEALTIDGSNNGTHVLCVLTRRDMEKLCEKEFLALLRPIREVAIMAGALLPGDTNPTSVEAAMQMDEYDSLVFDDFYKDEKDSDGEQDEIVDDEMLLQLQAGMDEMSVKDRKKAQQRGRKTARDVTKRERKYRQEKRKISKETPAADATDVKVRDGINGRPISRVVLVGGATRMPTIGRLLAALTGVVPQKTVNPDEAVALGCAVHVGVLDGQNDFGTVLNPMQAAILRAVAERQQKQGLLSVNVDVDDDDDDDDKFDTKEFF